MTTINEPLIDVQQPVAKGPIPVPTTYVTYIATSTTKLWQTLISTEFTRHYFFGRSIELGTKPGEAFILRMPNGEIDSQGKILRYEPGHALSVTWHVEWMEELRHLPESIVTFTMVQLGEVVRLNMEETHPHPIEEKYLEGGRRGWPIVLSGLKTLLETGKPLPEFPM